MRQICFKIAWRRHNELKEYDFALFDHMRLSRKEFSLDFGKKPPSVSRGENKSGRWTDRASTTLPTGYFSSPEIQRTVPAMDTRRFELPIAVAIIPWSVINLVYTTCKVWIHGMGYRKDALRDSFLFEPMMYTDDGQKFCDIYWHYRFMM